MSSKVSRRVGFSPDVNEKPPTTYHKTTKVGGTKRGLIGSASSFRETEESSFSPVEIIRRIGARVARVLRCVPIARTRRSSCKVSSSSLVRSKSYADHTIDSHRAEAVEDCIEFLNSSSSSSSMRRSFSVSTNSS